MMKRLLTILVLLLYMGCNCNSNASELIGILSAMPQELEIITKDMSDVETVRVGDSDFLKGTMPEFGFGKLEKRFNDWQKRTLGKKLTDWRLG